MIEGRMMGLCEGLCKKRKEKTETFKYVINGIYPVSTQKNTSKIRPVRLLKSRMFWGKSSTSTVNKRRLDFLTLKKLQFSIQLR